MYEKLCITVQLYHFPSKAGPNEIYEVVYIAPVNFAIESPLGEEGGWENNFPGNLIFHPIPNGARARPNGVGGNIYLFSLCPISNIDKL